MAKRYSVPRKLTLKLQEDIVKAIDAGLRFKYEWCHYAGITTTTLDTWQELAKTDEPGAEDARRLFATIDEALAKRKARYLLQMQITGKDDWRMWREIIAMVDPKGYGPKAEVDITAQAAVNVVLTWGDNDADANHTAEAP